MCAVTAACSVVFSPIGPIAALGVADVRAGLGGVLLATPTAAWRRVVARWLAACCLAAPQVVALAVHDGTAGLGLLAIVATRAAVGIALTTIARTAVTFESLALIAWYLGPVNRVAQLDPAQLVKDPVAVCTIAAVVTLAALSLAAHRAATRLDSARS